MAVVAALIAPAGASGAIDFEPTDPSSFPAGDGASAVEVLDADADGLPDMVVAGQSLNMLFGTGSAGFGAPVLVEPGMNPGNGLVTARFDGNRTRDLAVINDSFNPARVSILRGRGDGTFRSPRSYEAGGGAFELAVGDFDGDRNRDLVASAFNEERVSVLFGRGDGTFEKARRIDVGNETSDIAAGDLNRDGRSDFVAVTNSSLDPGLSVAYGRANRRFRQPDDLEIGLSTHAIAVADADADGRRDIAVTNAISGGDDFVSILWRKKRGFTAPTSLGLGDVGPQSLAVADFNGDGLRELATGNTDDNVTVLENTGARTFAAGVEFFVGDEPQDVEAAKVDGDDLLDLVTANNLGDSVSVLLNAL